MRYWWIASLPVVIVGFFHAAACDGAGPGLYSFDIRGCGSDGNPCTIENCSNLKAQPTFVPNGTIVEVGPGNAGPAPECQQWVCRNGTPVSEPLRCSGQQAYCKANQCIACDDHLQNGAETGVDCGGICGKCNGESSTAANECASGILADGVCCDETCDGTCESCKLPNTFGTCTYVNRGWGDGACNGGSACDGAGACKAKAGSQCNDDAGCLDSECVGACSAALVVCTDAKGCSTGSTCEKQCRLRPGEACQQDADCGSLSCNGVCQ